MESSELRELLTPEGLALLDRVSAGDAADVVRAVSTLRAEGHSPSLVAAVLTQARLREKARGKFGDFTDRMLFTPAGLEQASRLRVAALHAGRFRGAGITRVGDLGCGIGADSLAMSALGIAVTAVEADEVTAAIAAYNLAPFPDSTVVHGRAEETPLDDLDGVYLDPARRAAGHNSTGRLSDPEAYSPSLTQAFEIASRLPAGIKLGPGLDRELIPADAEAQWVSVDGQLVEMGLWFGPLARDGIRRSALVIDGSGSHELSGENDADDPAVRTLGSVIYEPDGAVIRARQLGALAERLGAGTIESSIAYLSGDAVTSTPFASAFAVREVFPLDQKTLRRELSSRGIGTLEIKKRGVDIDPATFRTALKLKGSASATLILTRAGGKRVAILADRIA